MEQGALAASSILTNGSSRHLSGRVCQNLCLELQMVFRNRKHPAKYCREARLRNGAQSAIPKTA